MSSLTDTELKEMENMTERLLTVAQVNDVEISPNIVKFLFGKIDEIVCLLSDENFPIQQHNKKIKV